MIYKEMGRMAAFVERPMKIFWCINLTQKISPTSLPGSVHGTTGAHGRKTGAAIKRWNGKRQGLTKPQFWQRFWSIKSSDVWNAVLCLLNKQGFVDCARALLDIQNKRARESERGSNRERKKEKGRKNVDKKKRVRGRGEDWCKGLSKTRDSVFLTPDLSWITLS